MFPPPPLIFILFFFLLTLIPTSTFALPPSPHQTPTPLHLRAPTITPGTLSIWRVPNTATYITITLTNLIPAPAPALQQLLTEVYNAALLHLQTVGDGLLAQGALTWYGPAVGEYLDGAGAGAGGDGLVLRVWNANNHQLTYGVFGAAVTGLRNWMVLNQVFGTVRFDIFDGPNMVGMGMIE